MSEPVKEKWATYPANDPKRGGKIVSIIYRLIHLHGATYNREHMGTADDSEFASEIVAHMNLRGGI